MNKIIELVSNACSKVDFLSKEQERELIIKAQQKDKSAINDLFCANSRYLLKEARKYEKSYGLPLEDSFDAACEGYLRAIQRFDLNKQNRLITLAGFWIRYMEQETLRQKHLIAVPYKKLAEYGSLAGNIASLDAAFDSEEESSLLDFVADEYCY